jgi:hypothetical protein
MIKDFDFKKVAQPEFKQEIDITLASMVSRFYSDSEGARYLKDSKSIDKAYYIRSITEIVLRLRMKRTIDALTIHYFTKHNPFLAKKWAQYTEDEMLHDRMFAKDVERVGGNIDDIYKTKPYRSTKLLQGYFYYGIEHEGRPLASLVSSYFIETMSLLTQPEWMNNVERSLGSGSAKGHKAHIAHDLEDDHSAFVWNVITYFVESESDKEIVREHLETVFQLFCAYYREIYQDFFGSEESKGAALLSVA